LPTISGTLLLPEQPVSTRQLAVLFAPVLLLAGCRPGTPPASAPPPPVVTVARPVMTPVQNFNTYNGYLEAVEVVEIRARVKGFLEEVLFKEGDEVAAGAPLYKIDPREYAAAVSKSKADIARAVADLASANAQVQLAEAELGRLKSLGTNASRSELDRATATLAANKAAVEVAVANQGSANAALRTAELQLGYADIKAPIAGKISRTLVTRGNLVGGAAADTLLTTIVSVDPVYVYFDVPEKDLLEYQNGVGAFGATRQTGARKVMAGVATEQGFPHVGEINFRENRVDSGTGTVKLRGVLPNSKSARGEWVLSPGLFARVQVPLGPPAPRPVIPEEALMTGQEGRFVYLIGPENKVQKRTVKVGAAVWRAPPADDKAPRWQLSAGQPSQDGKPPPPGVVRSVVAIEDGLTADDVVIVNGLQKARPGAAVAPDERQFLPPSGK
jgi:RND family efflux transporter MFP subunit